MPSTNNTQAEQMPATLYDPAYNTLRFDILAVLSAINTTDLCGRCKHVTLLNAKRAFEAILNTPQAATSSSSHIMDTTIDLASGTISFTTTANPTPTTVPAALLTRTLLSPSGTTHSTGLLSRLLDPLSFPSDDTLNLSQTQLWFCLAGKQYTLLDAIHPPHAPLSEFVHTHMQHLNNICRGNRTGAQANHASFCPQGPASRCFGLPIAPGYPFPGEPRAQREAALRHAMEYMDPGVVAVIEEQFRHSEEWPKDAGLDERRPDWLGVLAAVERMPAFRARMEGLRNGEGYRRMEGEVEGVVRQWRVRGGVQEGTGWGVEEVEDVEETGVMVVCLVQELIDRMQEVIGR